MSYDGPTLLTSAIQVAKSLHETILSFQNYERTIRDLLDRIGSLIQALENLQNVITDEGSIVSMLEVPVLSCHQRCGEFDSLIKKCTNHSSGSSRTSFKDLALLRYMGGSIGDFKDMLSGYQNTIYIALGSLNIMTRDTLDRHNEAIRETTADLKYHLQDINDTLAAIASRARSEPDPTVSSSVKMIEKERQSAQQRILKCESLRPYIQILQDDTLDRRRLLTEIDTTKHCLKVCSLAAKQASKRVPVFNDVSIEDSISTLISQANLSALPEQTPKSYIKPHLKNLLLYGYGSDLTIDAADRHYALHHIHVCLRSEELRSFCRLRWNNQRSPSQQTVSHCGGTLDLSTNHPEAVNCLVQFLYLDDYDPSSIVLQLPAQKDDHRPPLHSKVNLDQKQPILQTHTTPLMLHAKVYALADCYNIPDLQQLALRKFNAIIPEEWSDIEDVPAFLTLVDEVYTSTNDSDTGLRNTVAKVFHQHIEQLLQIKEANDLLIKMGL